MFPASWGGVQPRNSWNAPAHTELLPRSLNFSIFVIIIIIIIIITLSPLRRVFDLDTLNNLVSWVYSVAAILRVLLMVYITLSSMLNFFVLLH
jgi:hypothetical protein